MAVAPLEDALSGGDRDFLENSYLTYMVPLATNFDFQNAVDNREGSLRALFESIEDRESLFFDESVDVYLILRTPYLEGGALRSYLSRLSISLEAQILNGQHVAAAGRDSPPMVEAIYNGAVEDVEHPLAVVDEVEQVGEDGEDGSEESEGQNEGGAQVRQVYAVWKLPVFLGRPRARLQAPSVSFLAAAALKPAKDPSATRLKKGYLQSREPSGLNLLESFASDPALGGVKPRLSAQRVSRVAPVAPAKDLHRPLRGLKAATFKIYPAVHTRVRFARPNAVPAGPAIIALLEIDFTPFFDCEVLLAHIDLSLPAGVVTDLNEGVPGLALPLSCVAHDHVTFMYRLAPRLEHELDAAALRSPTRELNIAVEVTALVKPGVCEPRLRMSWATTLDFTPPVNPGFGASLLSNPSLQRAHRPSQLSIDGAASFIAPAVSRPDALPSLEAAATRRSVETAVPDFGITMTFTAPEGPVFAGDEFSWSVFVVNRSNPAPAAVPNPTVPPPPMAAAAARKLALLALPRRRRNDTRVVRPPSTAGPAAAAATTATGNKTALSAEQVADAVLDENIVHAMQRSSLVDSTDVVCLSADTRVGPLAPNACHVAELRFLALREGLVGVEAIRVVDLATQEHVDVRELPVMIVEKRRE